ncbi:DNA-binding transcription repressor [Mortierella hygrophila]|uniref:DNA-binding transcription repressor n=1 Tax=Mortierella hygrophila TaxID=979708 RepID=A0A9P6K284_9FUNG|nr:DNA-binding transcription repressor [Mortierella hygrophila]
MSAQVSVPNMVADSSSTTSIRTTRRMRVPLSSLQNMASTGKFPLTPKEIEALQLKGVLRSTSHHIQTSSALSTSISSSSSATPRTATTLPPSPQAAPADPSTPPSSAYTFSASSPVMGQFSSKPPLPIAARLAPLISSGRPKNGTPISIVKARKRGTDAHLAIPYKERPLPSFHEGEIVDTCSHLDGPQVVLIEDDRTGFRRHSDASTANRTPVPEDTLAFDPSRRASIATASPMVPSLLGNRRVLYKASYGLTLFSLPSQPLAPKTATPTHTEAMSSFKFPAESSSSAAPLPSPSSPSTLSPGMFATGFPMTPLRSKRKSSIPMRSPSWNGAQDGVIFQLPFGTPPMPAMTPRAGSAGCPSPVMQMATPPSPDRRSGLGIQVEETFKELGATHPLEASSAIASGAASQPISFTDEDSTMSIGDIIIAEQEASAANRTESQASGSQGQGQGMPTPPLTSRVPSLGVMESQPDRELMIEKHGSIPPTPVTPSRKFGSSSSTTTDQDAQEATSNQQETDDRQDRAGSTTGSATEVNQEQDDDTDSVLPLWAQRQLSIRRQSAIPRPELDFVSGSGILPPASRGLKTVGGAKILSYPVLISDMVHVVLDDIQAKGGVLDGSDVTEESEEESSEQQQQHLHVAASAGRGGKTGGRGSKTANLKRKKGGSGQKGRGAKPQAHNHPSPDDDGQSGDDAQEDLDDKPRSGHMTGLYKKRRQSVSAGHHGQERQWHQLAPPVELRVVRRVAVVEDYAMNIDYEGGAASDMNDEDYDDGTELAAQQRHISASSSYKPHNRLQNVPEHLRIPPQEVDLAMQLSREMMENKKRKKAHKEKDGKKKRRGADADEQENDDGHRIKGKGKGKQVVRNNEPSDHVDADAGLRRASLKTLKPLLDATMAVEQQEGRKRFNAWDEDYNGDEDTAEADHVAYYHGTGLVNQYFPGMMTSDTLTTSTMGPSGGAAAAGTGKKSSKTNGGTSGHSASSSTGSATGAGTNGGPSPSLSSASPKKPAKARESKATTKKCEACGASETPCWRPGYTAHSALCNSCGLRYKKSNVFCAKVGCKYIPLKTEYAAMEAERVKSGRAHLVCHKCKGPVALPIIKE